MTTVPVVRIYFTNKLTNKRITLINLQHTAHKPILILRLIFNYSEKKKSAV